MNKETVMLLKQNFDLSRLENKKVTDLGRDNKKLSSVFSAIDSNNDGIISKQEVSIFKNVLQSADSDADGNITNKELKSLLKTNSEFVQRLLQNGKVKATNIVDFISALTAKNEVAKTASTVPTYQVEAKTPSEIQDSAITTIQDEVDNAYEIFNGHDNGAISASYNACKELFGSKLSKSAVARNMFIKNETAELLRRAKAGTLTKSEYYNIIKENLMQTFPGVEEMSAEEQQKLADMINSLSPERVEQMQKKILALPSPDSPDYDAAVQDFGRNFVRETCTVIQDTTVVNGDGISSSQSKANYKANSAYQLEGGNELMSFDDVYKIRNGVAYNEENIQKYNQLKSQYAIQQSFNELQAYVHDSLDKADSNSAIEKALTEILSPLTQAKDDDSLTKILRHMTGMNDISVVQGKINASDLQAVKEALLAKIDAQVNEISGGKSFEEISKNLEEAYKQAYGEENVELLAKAYVQEQENFVKYTRTALEVGGSVAAVVGMFCCPPLAVGAGLVGSFGGIGIEMLEEATKDKASAEKIAALKKELAMNAALFVTGMGSGAIGSMSGALANSIATKCPVLLSTIAERGVDATLSLISTMAITGELDLQGVGLSQVLAVVAGLKTAKIGAKNATAEPEALGITPWAYNRSGIFSKFFGSKDINPNSPLNKYKPSRSSYGQSHSDFHANNPHLFQGTHDYGYWAGQSSSDRHHGAWKMHLFSVSEEDWQRLADVIIPYLKEHDIDWKTLNAGHSVNDLNGGIQQGKAFTIYPRDKAHFEQIARDLDYIIRNNNLQTSNSSIVGDRNLGDTGRIFYRYEYKSGKNKDDVLDLTNRADQEKYFYELYDSNDDRVARNGEGRYLADDMTTADDPWYNFNPADPASHPSHSSSNQKIDAVNNKSNSHYRYKMEKDAYYEADMNTRLELPNGVCFSLSDPYIKSVINAMPEGTSIAVGRNPECAIRIKEECVSVSRVHLIIYKQNGHIYIKDVSTYGSNIVS